MSVRALPKDNRFVTWTDWQGYSKFLEAIGDRPIRLTYDQGALEIMSPTQEHEHIKTILGHLLVTLVDELGMELEAGGSMTFRREDLDRGLEPDECYWIANAHLVVEGEYDAATGPPPDLVVEVDITRRSIDRMKMYASMGVPEVWRYDRKKGLLIYQLSPSGKYLERPLSPTFPQIPLSEFHRLLKLRKEMTLTAVVRAFRGWLRTFLETQP